tara:strand:+ start:948 stop:1112 length:165 start_codon:yes stop_codon:yes gene_type:complete
LQNEMHNERKRNFYNDHFSSKGKSGWAMMENPPEYLEEGNEELPYPIEKKENDV